MQYGRVADPSEMMVAEPLGTGLGLRLGAGLAETLAMGLGLLELPVVTEASPPLQSRNVFRPPLQAPALQELGQLEHEYCVPATRQYVPKTGSVNPPDCMQ